MSDAYLYKDLHDENYHTLAKFEHRSSNVMIGMHEVEQILKYLGFMARETMEERLEFMRFWTILL